jgi:hypothetical protein
MVSAYPTKEAAITRRRFIMNAAALTLALPVMGGCSDNGRREAASRDQRQAFAAAGGDRLLFQQELVRYATLAASSHNTQCWKFRLQENLISIEPDLARRCPVVDPDDHHLFVSLGCATENLAQAALANGFQANAGFDAAAEGRIAVSLEPSKAIVSPLFQAITARQSTRGDYDGQPLSAQELRLLEQAGSGKGVRVLLLTERAAMENVLEYVLSGNNAQLADPAFMDELKSWIRFSDDEALRTGDGLFAGATGNPTMPRWLGSRMMGLFVTAKSENERYAKELRSSAGIAVFVGDAADKAHWFEVGRCFERFALQATALGIRNAHLNQPVEVAAVRPQFAAALGLGKQRPDLVVRFGRGPVMPMSMRRPVASVLV